MGTGEITQRATAAEDGRTHQDLGPRLNLVFWLLASLSFVFLCLRLYCKIYRGRDLWWDDHFLVAAWVRSPPLNAARVAGYTTPIEHVADDLSQVSLLVSATTTSVCVSLGYGLNADDMPKENLPKMPFIAVFAGFFSVLSAAWSKTSFGLTLLRLCQGWIKGLVWFIIISVNLILGTAMLLMWVKCRPFAKIWDDRIQGWSGSADVILALLPWTIIFNMRKSLNIKERLGIAVAMSMGIV
ncbi:hypothetical protein NEMBOFW57_010594 [Staphylotrichum longicolle]|uniref:Rhodopsin domain-containing protein n=1 Tax=Staphylotrichum longicolle TaxID=669026 RepID=A0AAD4END1_9PEZI|nr:hypothetical protein NEMBOFW57_010594 [Staphylotrichum longicolle]